MNSFSLRFEFGITKWKLKQILERFDMVNNRQIRTKYIHLIILYINKTLLKRKCLWHSQFHFIFVLFFLLYLTCAYDLSYAGIILLNSSAASHSLWLNFSGAFFCVLSFTASFTLNPAEASSHFINSLRIVQVYIDEYYAYTICCRLSLYRAHIILSLYIYFRNETETPERQQQKWKLILLSE